MIEPRTTVPLLRLAGIGKSYGGVIALEGVDLDIFPGDVLALCGDNGAGKSTLIKIVSGAQPPSAGTMMLKGKPVTFRSPHDALEQGVATIYQDLALCPRLSIAQNIFLGSELRHENRPPFLRFLDRKGMAAQARELLARLSVPITDMRRPVEGLSGGQRQAVAISRALRWSADIIIMDEPTAALGVRETAEVHELIRRLKGEGKTIILISHNMRDVAALATRVAILSHGVKVADRAIDGLTAEDIHQMILRGAAAQAA